MTVATRNGHKTGGPQLKLLVPQHELVGDVMDWQALAEEAIDANGASLETVLRLPPGPWRDELQRAHHYAHDRLLALLIELRMAAGKYDGRPAGQ
jgi:hypothetical protein